MKPAVKHRFLMLGLLGTLSAFGPLSMDLYLPALPVIQHDVNASATLIQMTITMSLLGLAGGQLIIGPLSDHYGRKWPLISGLVLFTLASLGIALSNNIWVILLLRLIQGIGGSAGQVLSRSIARDLFSGHELTRYLSVLMAINGIFPIISPVLGSGILTLTDWNGIFYLLAAIGAILIVLALTILPETLMVDQRTQAIGHAFRGMGELVKTKSFMTYVLTQGLVYGALFSYISGSTFVYQQYYGLSAGVFSIFYAVNGLGIVLITKLTGNLIGKYTEKQLLSVAITIGTLAGGVLLANALTLNNFWIMVVGLWIVVGMVGMVNTTATSLGMQQSGQQAGSASALLGLGMNAIGGIMSPLVGAFGTTSPLPMASLIIAAELAAYLLWTMNKQTA
ncbi:multidrug effflux MFS transporter [Lacticaseibacillus saniviri]|uniref:Bcr/CflA family efflux transporter n=1 Tax=Lacticaseibacillus saniviri JCM 17471 = DSM 24301 TaxID=1293598 RepID=A0A0R2MWH4_9LACO|nr:multidrug effflux MFS transporter [Lacticaseibacillus saniviri]KRO17847.1 Permease of the major facilitator superfamily protein [Lacticaseibacillus saniviri JCM 17471 = DSM 24301]